MFKFRKAKSDRTKLQQAKRILDLDAECEALRRTIAIKDVELEQLAAIVARDRERVKSETASYVRQRAAAEHEGTHGQLS